MNLDIDNIASTNQHIWRSIYELIHNSYFKIVNLFPKISLNQCKNYPNEPQNIPNEVKNALKMAM